MDTVPHTAPAATVLSARARAPDHVVFRGFVAETVMLNLESGQYHGLNPVGGRMLETLERCGTVGEAARVLAEDFERPVDEIERDIVAFCRDLAERGLIVLEPGG